MASTRNPRMFRYRIARRVGDVTQYAIYVGPGDKIPAGWSVCFRAVARSGVAA